MYVYIYIYIYRHIIYIYIYMGIDIGNPILSPTAGAYPESLATLGSKVQSMGSCSVSPLTYTAVSAFFLV